MLITCHKSQRREKFNRCWSVLFTVTIISPMVTPRVSWNALWTFRFTKRLIRKRKWDKFSTNSKKGVNGYKSIFLIYFIPSSLPIKSFYFEIHIVNGLHLIRFFFLDAFVNIKQTYSNCALVTEITSCMVVVMVSNKFLRRAEQKTNLRLRRSQFKIVTTYSAGEEKIN